MASLKLFKCCQVNTVCEIFFCHRALGAPEFLSLLMMLSGPLSLPFPTHHRVINEIQDWQVIFRNPLPPSSLSFLLSFVTVQFKDANRGLARWLSTKGCMCSVPSICIRQITVIRKSSSRGSDTPSSGLFRHYTLMQIPIYIIFKKIRERWRDG